MTRSVPFLLALALACAPARREEPVEVEPNIDPVAVDRTRFVTFTLGRAQAGGGTPSDAVRDTEFVRLGAAEDLAVAMGVQRGLASGANEVLEFGRFEGAITHFHRQLHELVDGAGS
jgi:hypothetical protein